MKGAFGGLRNFGRESGKAAIPTDLAGASLMTGVRRIGIRAAALGRRLAWCGLVATSIGILPTGSRAETPEQIVRKLGSPRFQERHSAEQQILENPEDVYGPLKIQAESAHPEVQLRARRLLKVVQRRVLERQFERFGETGDPKLAPIGWERFAEIVGDSPESAKLYLSMFLAHPEALTALVERSGDLQPAFNNLFSDVFPWQQDSRNFSLETFATILYLASSPDCPLDRVAQIQVSHLLTLSQTHSAIRHGDSHEELQRLLGQWVSRKEAGSAESRFAMAQRFDLEEATLPALEMVQGAVRERVDRDASLVEAVLHIAQKGTPEDVVDLEPLLDDETRFADWSHELKNGEREHITSQIRDVALVASIHLMRQSPREFGFRNLATSPKFLFVPNSTGFSTEEERDKAFRHWAEWRRESSGAIVMGEIIAIEGVAL